MTLRREGQQNCSDGVQSKRLSSLQGAVTLPLPRYFTQGRPLRLPATGTHEAWNILEPRCKATYEQIAENGLTIPLDVIEAAGMSSSRGYEALARLTAAGLINRSHRHVELGPLSLDDFADRTGGRTDPINPVHEAWRILGRNCWHVYEQIVEHGRTAPVEIFAVVGIGTTTGYKALAKLAAAGLVRRGWRRVDPGSVSLDDFLAAGHRTT
ncbi:hypothetical protein [Nocardia abscessus]|uniref:hypothetical protein n=1 Tax=Nocardia abscessus TaxID=120957 RepID=UPI00245484FD|nr:hypothetical protein [Nocardia abscessus]